MPKYSDDMAQFLLQRLDPLDVLEFIDYHPESIQRNADEVLSWCPLCQNTNGRYLKINLTTKQFESNPPDGPDQSGNLIELFMRTKRLNFDDAVHALGDEFSIPLLEGDFREQLNTIAFDAETHLESASDPTKKDTALRLADESFSRVLIFEPRSLRAWRGKFLVNQQRKNQTELRKSALQLMELMAETEDVDGQREVAEEYLKTLPDDDVIREHLARLLLQQGAVGDGARELVVLADHARSAKKYDKALAYYREIQRQNLEQLDVLPMIISLLTSQGKTSEARAEIQREVVRLQEVGRYMAAAGAAARKLELDPDDDATRINIVELCVAAGLDDAMALPLEMVGTMMKAGRFEPAAEALGILTAERPDNTLILEMLISAQRGLGEHNFADTMELRLAELYTQQGKKDVSLELLERIIRDNPQDEQALIAIGELLIEMEKRPEAIEYLRRVVELQIEAKNHKKALETVLWILGLDSSLTDMRATEAKLLFLTGSKDESAKIIQLLTKQFQKSGDKKRLAGMLQDVVEWNPDDAESRLLLSSLYDQLGDVERSDDVRQKLIMDLLDKGEAEIAETTVRNLLKKDPKSAKLRMELADVYLGQESRQQEAKELYTELEKEFAAGKNHAEQRKVLEKLRRLDPKNPEYLERLKDVQTALGDTQATMKTRLALLRLSRERGETDDSEEIAREILEADPEQSEALANLYELQMLKNQTKEARNSAAQYSSLLYQRGSYKEAEQFLTGVLNSFPADIELLERSIACLRKMSKPDALMERVDQLISLNSYSSEKKVRIIRDILQDDPQFTEAQRRLTRLLRAAGRIDELIDEIKQSIKTQQAAGRTVEVVDLYEQLLEADPDDIPARETLLKLLQTTGQETRFIPHMLGLATAYSHARRLDEAVDSFNLILDMEQENEAAYRGLIKALRLNGENDVAVRRLRELVALFLRKEKVDEAIDVYREITQIEPNNQEARREIISLKRELGHLNDAADELGRLAETLRGDGDAEGAIAARREAVLLQPDSLAIHKALVAELKAASRADDAQEEAIKLSQKLSQTRQYDHALAILDEMIGEDDENIVLRRARAHFFDERGDERRALQEYRELEKLGQRAGTAVITRDPRQMPLHPELEQEIGLELLPEYDFDTFVVGARNKFAHATAKAVADHPGTARNPLFLYSGVGLGKTHLMHAIANQMIKNNPKCRVVYTSTEYFTTAMEHAREKNLLSEFRGRHRATDVLLLDDIQFLAGREESQEEFFHIFNMLHQARKQIVVTSDRPPKDIASLDMRLRTRFGQGVIVDIQSPDLETRLVILRAEARRRAFNVPEDALAVIANKIITNVRELKGAFNLFLEHHEIGGEPLDSKTAKEIVDKYYTA